MMGAWMSWLERMLSGGGGLSASSNMASGVAAEPLRICFDASTEGAVEAESRRFDLVIVPAVWHRRSELLASVAALLRQSGRRYGVRVELLVAHDAADVRLATQCEVLVLASNEGSALHVRRL